MKDRLFAVLLVMVIGVCGSVRANLIFPYDEAPIEDATVDSEDMTIRGDEAELSVQGYADGFYSLESVKRTFLKFDLSAIPDDATITEAIFGIYFFEGNDGGLNTMDPHAALYFADDSWHESGEGGVTWANQPAGTPGYIDDEIAMEGPDYYEWNLLSDLGESDWSNYAADLEDDMLSLMLVTPDEEQNNFARYHSSEATELQPYLKIYYAPEPTTIALLGLGGLLLRRRK